MRSTKTTTLEEQTGEIQKGDHVIVFDGYSGLGYEHPEAVCAQMREDIEKAAKAAMSQSPAASVWVVAGATADGIGMCYDVADEVRASTGANILNVGIVSEQALVKESWGQALPPEQVAKLDRLILAPDPKGTWQVIGSDGHSMMVSEAFLAASRGAVASFEFLGGGGVAKSELDEIAARLPKEGQSIQVDIHHGQDIDAPNPEKALKKAMAMAEKGKSPGQIADELDGSRDYLEGEQAGSLLPASIAGLRAKLDAKRAGEATAQVAAKPKLCE